MVIIVSADLIRAGTINDRLALQDLRRTDAADEQGDRILARRGLRRRRDLHRVVPDGAAAAAAADEQNGHRDQTKTDCSLDRYLSPFYFWPGVRSRGLSARISV